MYLAHIKHPLISENAAIDFQLSAQARTVSTKNILSPYSVEKKLNAMCLLQIITSSNSENMMKSLSYLTYLPMHAKNYTLFLLILDR